MNTSLIPPTNPYTSRINGVFGQFGSGRGVDVSFLQATLRPDQLGLITLVRDIEGSDQWPVRDLFQREVDDKRVDREIKPYLENQHRVKFFNPLTLTLVPLDNQKQVIGEIPSLQENEIEDDGCKWKCLESPGFFRFRSMISGTEPFAHYSIVEWNPVRVKLVAIDGQHRASALQRITTDPNSPIAKEFSNWSIPVVIAGMGANPSPVTFPPTFLEVVRNMFVLINTEANQVSEARQILLNDDVVGYLCTQELLNVIHLNDSEPISERKQSLPPLLMFDWRGAIEEAHAAAIPSVELFNWIDSYIVGTTEKRQVSTQKAALGVSESPDDKVNIWFEQLGKGTKRQFRHPIPKEIGEEIRALFVAGPMTAILHVLSEFTPFQNYIVELRKAEKSWVEKDDMHRHAYHQLRFGTSSMSGGLESVFQLVYSDIVSEIAELKIKAFRSEYLTLNIGLRGIMYALGAIFFRRKSMGRSIGWDELGGQFVSWLNVLFAQGWFSDSPEMTRLRDHICLTPTGNVKNYRLHQIGKGAGLLTLLGVLGAAKSSGTMCDEDLEDFSDLKADLKDLLFKSYLSQFKKLLQNQHEDWSKKKIEGKAVEKAEKEAKTHWRKILVKSGLSET
jgi:hypothetical protein